MAKNKAEEREDEEPDLVMVGDGADEDDNASESPAKSKNKVAAQEADDDEDESEESDRLGHDDEEEREEDDSDTEGEKPGKQAARSAERKTRKQRQREARERDRTELNFLRSRNEQLERRFSGVEARLNQNEQSGIAQRLAQVKSNLAQADVVLAEAMKANQGEDAVEALKIRDQLLKEQTRLELAAQQRRPTRTESSTPQVTPEHRQLATEFLSRNSWLQQGGPDASVFVAVDDALLKEGNLSPGSPAYWRELERRAKKYLPHRFKANGKPADDDDLDDDDAEDQEESEPDPKPKTRSKPAGGPKVRIGGREVPLKKGQVHVSAERRKAMEDAGVWDDATLRKQYLASYAKYDREHTRGSKH